MEVTLLGTGGGSGWPHPFCTCASCNAAAAEGEIRAHTSALIDGVLLLDCGQDVPRSAVRFGVGLERVRHVLVTHDHHDHANGAALLWRRWAGRTEPLDVHGPRSALDSLAMWLPPDKPCSKASTLGGRMDKASTWRRAILRSSAGFSHMRAMRPSTLIDMLLYTGSW